MERGRSGVSGGRFSRKGKERGLFHRRDAGRRLLDATQRPQYTRGGARSTNHECAKHRTALAASKQGRSSSTQQLAVSGLQPSSSSLAENERSSRRTFLHCEQSLSLSPSGGAAPQLRHPPAGRGTPLLLLDEGEGDAAEAEGEDDPPSPPLPPPKQNGGKMVIPLSPPPPTGMPVVPASLAAAASCAAGGRVGGWAGG